MDRSLSCCRPAAYRRWRLLYCPGLFLRLAFRMALAFAMRRCSLFDTNQRFFRAALRMPALTTALRQRFSNSSCDSPTLKLTDKTDTSYLCRITVEYRSLHHNKKTRLASLCGTAEQGSRVLSAVGPPPEAHYRRIPSKHLLLPLTPVGIRERFYATSATSSASDRIWHVIGLSCPSQLAGGQAPELTALCFLPLVQPQARVVITTDHTQPSAWKAHSLPSVLTEGNRRGSLLRV